MNKCSTDESSYTLTQETTQVSKNVCGPEKALGSPKENNFISSLFLLYFPLLSSSHPPSPQLLPQRWVPMNGETVHSSSPGIKSVSPPCLPLKLNYSTIGHCGCASYAGYFI